MKKRRSYVNKTSFIFLILFLLLSTSLYAESILPSGLNESELEQNVERMIVNRKDHDAGLAVSIFKNEETIFESYAGLGNKEQPLKIDRQAVFEWGSITKLLVWVSIMQLNEAGKLELTQDIRTLLPTGFFKRLKYDEPITPLHLMNHTGGWQDVLVGLFAPVDSSSNLEEALRTMEPPQIERPGMICSYSNWGAALGGLLVERISGKPFYQYVHDHIFTPLEIKHTALRPDLSDNLWVKEARAKMAGYDFKGELIELSDLGVPLYPAGQATGTLEDITRFAKALNDRSEESTLFQKRATLERFQQPTLLFKEYGLPINAHGMWATNYRVPTLGHMGGTVKFFSFLSFHPETGYGCVILSNNKSAFDKLVEIPAALFGALNSVSPENSMPEDAFKGIEGFYIDARNDYKRGFMKLLRVLSLTKVTAQGENRFTQFSAMGKGTIKKNDVGIFEYLFITPMLTVEMPQMCTVGKVDDGRTVMHRYYGDAIKISGKSVAADLLLFALFFMALLYATAHLLVRNSRFLFRLITKRAATESTPQIKRRRRFNLIASCLIMAVWINTWILYVQVFSFTASRTRLQLNLLINIIIGVAIIAYLLFMGYTLCKKGETGKPLKGAPRWHISIYITMVFLVAVALNIYYWELWRF